ncbi:hypothetical protein PTQ19_11940 [Microbacterium esteraromaticum]|uniref:hypothetical protein n=1 Tax=Microbacterium esteraromaticum TaxID=57043 RepID=UPI00236774CE|nr:hypothetical protein [Microbacterium esteraromaticum]WDH78222.1 hypothetical protein PTQ19_11940 [Microbacterium esteraromaticum]
MMAELPPAGWYPRRSEMQWWDGTRWGDPAPQASQPAAPALPAQYVQHPVATSSPTTSASGSNGLAITALIIGIVAFFIGWIPVLGLLLGVAATVLAILAITRIQSKAMSVVGLVLGVLAAATSLVVTVAFTLGMTLFPAGSSGCRQQRRVHQ